MPSTHLSLNYHLVFSTKHREPIIETPWRDRLHEYMGGTIAGLGGVAMAAGGIADHVHLLIGLRATHAIADVLRELKSESSRWVHKEHRVSGFEWQEGYAAIAVSPSHIEKVRQYVLTQEEHHHTKTFQEEYRELLEKCGIPFDENTSGEESDVSRAPAGAPASFDCYRWFRCAPPPAKFSRPSGTL